MIDLIRDLKKLAKQIRQLGGKIREKRMEPIYRSWIVLNMGEISRWNDLCKSVEFPW